MQVDHEVNPWKDQNSNSNPSHDQNSVDIVFEWKYKRFTKEKVGCRLGIKWTKSDREEQDVELRNEMANLSIVETQLLFIFICGQPGVQQKRLLFQRCDELEWYKGK